MIERSSIAPQIFTDGSWSAAPDAERSARTDVRLLTWNTWFGNHMFDERRRALLAELQRRRVDVIALQEVTQRLLGALLEEPWVRTAYHVSEVAVRTSYDVVLLSRLPIRRVFTVTLPTGMGRRLVVVELACGLAVGTVHLESMRTEAATRAAQLRIIQPALVECCEDVVLVGDMNFEPGAPLEHGVLEPAWVDTWPVLRPGEPGYTMDTDINTMYLSARREASRKRYDRVFACSPHWRARSIELIGARPIDGNGTFISDHFGLEAVFTAE